jgi:hypothetical protein
MPLKSILADRGQCPLWPEDALDMAEICISVGSTNDSSQLDRSGSAKIDLVVQGENARRVKELCRCISKYLPHVGRVEMAKAMAMSWDLRELFQQ